MKKLFFLSLLLACGITSLAQEIKIAPVIGPNISFGGFSKATRDIIKNDLPDALENEGIKGKINIWPAIRMQIGGLLDYSLNDAFSLQSGLLLNLRGYGLRMKLKDTGTNGSSAKYSGKMRVSYLELPIWSSYRMEESGLKLIIGPTFGFALGGKTYGRAIVDGDSESFTEKLSIGNEEGLDNVKPFDISLNLGIVKQLTVADQPLEISLNIQPSLTKWNVSSNSEYYGRFITVGIRAAYFFALK